jgi:NADH-quinone oxidoreductase subunit A
MAELQAGAMVGLFALLVLAVVTLILLANRFLGGYHPSPDKDTPFESGIQPTGDARISFSISYYLVAVSFLIFEFEAALLFAWGVDYWHLGIAGTLGAVAFIIILFLGLIYEWRKGGLSS